VHQLQQQQVGNNTNIYQNWKLLEN
jgi:hypothetical protein